MSEFPNEEALVAAFIHGSTCSEKSSQYGASTVVREFFYARGKTDVVFVLEDGEIVAFEAKLTRWRLALTQAYRNTCFAHRSFVVVPWRTATIAARYLSEFTRRGVGLCAVRGRSVCIIQEADSVDPVEPWLSDMVRRRAMGAANRTEG
jgi:hypothetical protein